MRLFLLVPAFLFAASSGVEHWTASDLKAYGTKLQPKASDKIRVAAQQLGDWGSHTAMIGRRTGDGEAELHEGMVDFFVVESGEATLVVGGTIPNPRTTGPGEIRGPAVEGGERLPLRTGDIVRIPTKVPHQLLVAKDFLYYVIKVKP